jgi:hypothetical protein
MDNIPNLSNSPRTPPFLNLSPDLRNLKPSLKSPAFDEGKFTLADMDFESAYALLTQSPNFNMTPMSHGMPSLNDSEFKDILNFKSQSPSPKIPTPVMNLETLQGFPQYDELLSVNETNALEHFLDSIIEKPDKTKHDQVPKRDFLSSFPNDVLTDSTPLGISLHPPIQPLMVIERHKEEAAVAEQPEVKPKTQRKRRKLLTEEEKKMHHTTSEQRRRGQIKETFARLISLLPLNHAKKTQSKSIVLETAGDEIDRLIKANRELRKLLEEE